MDFTIEEIALGGSRAVLYGTPLTEPDAGRRLVPLSVGQALRGLEEP